MTREEAIKRLSDQLNTWEAYDPDNGDMREAVEMAIEALEEKPKGQWLPRCGENWESYICSRCRHFEPYEFVLDGQPNEQGQVRLTQVWDCRYCPHCGAEMEVEE